MCENGVCVCEIRWLCNIFACFNLHSKFQLANQEVDIRSSPLNPPTKSPAFYWAN